jgi:hypothetical protein
MPEPTSPRPVSMERFGPCGCVTGTSNAHASTLFSGQAANRPAFDVVSASKRRIGTFCHRGTQTLRTLKDLARQAKTPEAAGAVASAAARLPVWIDLIALLSLNRPFEQPRRGSDSCTTCRLGTAGSAVVGVRPPTPAIRNEIRAALESARSTLPLPFAVRLERSLKPYL